MYIGSAIDMINRFNCHKYDLRNKRHPNQKLQRAWEKYGEDNFEFSVLEYIEDKNTLVGIEQSYLDSIDVFSGGYNICKKAGSRLGMKHTPETKEKLRITSTNRTPEARAKMSASQLGKKQSKELIAKRVLKRIGRPLSEQHRKNISLASFGKKMSMQARKKMSLAKTGVKREKITDETRIKMSEAARLRVRK